MDKCLKSNIMVTIETQLNQEITSLLHEEITYNEFMNDSMLIISAIKSGIPYSLFNLIQDYSPFTENDWAKFLDISTKSLHRYKMEHAFSFKRIHSEKIIEMAEVTKIGLDVFGDMEKLKGWLNTPNYALGKMKPIELITDSYGKELVIAEMTRIDQGIFV